MHFECTVGMGQLAKQEMLNLNTESSSMEKAKQANKNTKGTGMHNVKVTEASGKHISNALYLKSIHEKRRSWQSI